MLWIVDAHRDDGKLIYLRTKIHRSSETPVSEELPGCQNVVLIFFLMRYHTVVATRREINLARQFCRVSLVHRTETNFARQPFVVIRLLPDSAQRLRQRWNVSVIYRCSFLNRSRPKISRNASIASCFETFLRSFPFIFV